ncbi:MAG: 23S rRNA (uracil(1939)-C(5))-methyltransferase RlmD [Elusimicrobia bacterium]|nr:23S rRNA (uracil(1939)-C(5))-methyltransferase RlmD [Elusimicrobiota bacterium]
MSGQKEVLRLRVERMAPEGEAIARAEGSSRVVFVPYGAPGDMIEAEITAAKGTYARAQIRRVLEPGPDRIEPPCAIHFRPGMAGRFCGGCDWQHLGYEAQLKHKRGIVEDCLRRIGKMSDVEVRPTLASPHIWGYRNKVQIPFGFTDKGEIAAGFYSPQSHSIADFSACPVQPDLAVRLALKAKAAAQSRGWQVYDEKSGRGWLRHFFARTNARGQALVALVARTPDFPDRDSFIGELRGNEPSLASIYLNVHPEKTSAVLGPRWIRLWGAPRIEEQIGEFSFSASPGAFLQVNTPAAEVLYACARKALTEGAGRFGRVLDLYCGVGTLAVWLASAADKIIGIEENSEAVQDAWANARRNGVKNARFVSGRVETSLARVSRELSGACAAVVDPPRQGLLPGALRALTHRAFERVVYVSCNPATFARDAGLLSRAGYKLEQVQPVDLFPQTSHVELVGLLRRKNRGF